MCLDWLRTLHDDISLAQSRKRSAQLLKFLLKLLESISCCFILGDFRARMADKVVGELIILFLSSLLGSLSEKTICPFDSGPHFSQGVVPIKVFARIVSGCSNLVFPHGL